MRNLLIITNINLDNEVNCPNTKFLISVIDLLLSLYNSIYLTDGNNFKNLLNNSKEESLRYPHCIKTKNITQIILFEPLPDNFILSIPYKVYTSYFYLTTIKDINNTKLVNLELSDEIYVTSVHHEDLLKNRFTLKNTIIINPLYEAVHTINKNNFRYNNSKYFILIDLNYREINETFINIDSFIYYISSLLDDENILIVNNNQKIISNGYLYSIFNNLNKEHVIYIDEENPQDNFPINLYISINTTHVLNLDIIKYQHYGIPIIGLDTPHVKSWIISGEYLSDKIKKWDNNLKIWYELYSFKDLQEKISLIKSKGKNKGKSICKSICKSNSNPNEYLDKITAQSYMLCNTNLNKFENTINFYFNRPHEYKNKIAIIQFTNNTKVNNLNLNYSKKWNYSYYIYDNKKELSTSNFIKYYLEKIKKYLYKYDYLWVTINDIFFINYHFPLDKICNKDVFQNNSCLISNNDSSYNINTIVFRSNTNLFQINDKDKDLEWNDIIPLDVRIVPNQRLLYSDELSDNTSCFQLNDLAILLKENGIFNKYIDKLIKLSIYQQEYPAPKIIIDENGHEIVIFNRYQLSYNNIIFNYLSTNHDIRIFLNMQWESIFNQNISINIRNIETNSKYGIYIKESNCFLDFLLDKLIYCQRHNYNLYLGNCLPNKTNIEFLELLPHNLIWNQSFKLRDNLNNKLDNLKLINKNTFLVTDDILKNVFTYNIWSRLAKYN